MMVLNIFNLYNFNLIEKLYIFAKVMKRNRRRNLRRKLEEIRHRNKDFVFDKDEIQLLVFTSLMRVLKNKKLYCVFRTSVAHTAHPTMNFISALYYRLASFKTLSSILRTENYFTNALDINSFLRKMNEITHTPKKEDYDNDEVAVAQEYIVQCINTILHSCIERYFGPDIKKVEEIGQETFNMICTKLFGEGFEDKTSSANQPPLPHGLRLQDFEAMDKNEAVRVLSERLREYMARNQRDMMRNGAYGGFAPPTPNYDLYQTSNFYNPFDNHLFVDNLQVTEDDDDAF